MIIKKIQLYAETIKPLLEWIKENPNDKDVKYTVTRLIRFYSNTPKELGIPYMYSRAALQKAERLEIPDAEERLKWVTWRQQTNKAGLQDVGRIDGVFHLEHIVPVSEGEFEHGDPNFVDERVPAHKLKKEEESFLSTLFEDESENEG